MSLKRFFRYLSAIMILCAVCKVIDYGMFLYDHRFFIGVIIGSLLMEKTFNLLGKLDLFKE